MLTQNQLDDLSSALKALINAINDAYWSAGDIHSKDTLYNLGQLVTNAYDEIEEEDLAADDAALKSFKTTLAQVNTNLQAVKAQINSLTKSVQDAAAVASAIDKVVSTATAIGLV